MGNHLLERSVFLACVFSGSHLRFHAVVVYTRHRGAFYAVLELHLLLLRRNGIVACI